MGRAPRLAGRDRRAVTAKPDTTNDRAARRVVDLSHEIVPGEQTYPWLPAPRLSEFLSREESRQRYAPGTEFVIHQIELIGNSGTYLDAPLHRHVEGADLAGLPLGRIADLPAVVLDVSSAAARRIEPSALAAIGDDTRGRAVLLRTGWDRKWGADDYAGGSPFLGEAAARWLAARGVALVGIDALNVDDTGDAARPAHTILLGAGIPIVENLCNLEALPPTGARFSAVPARVRGCSAFPVRAFAVVQE